jgi:hypothetical protein
VKPELDVAIGAIEAFAVKGGRPTRYDARPILLMIGESLRVGRAEDVRGSPERLQALPEALRQTWVVAVQDELAMACTEHVRSVDPRYLDHPHYDFAYTVSARRELEARLRAAEHLGVLPDEALLGGVRRADALLEGRLGSRERGGQEMRERADRS